MKMNFLIKNEKEKYSKDLWERSCGQEIIIRFWKSLQLHNVMKAYFVLWFQEFPWVQAEEANEMGKETVMIPLKSTTSGVVKVGLTEGSGWWPSVCSGKGWRWNYPQFVLNTRKVPLPFNSRFICEPTKGVKLQFSSFWTTTPEKDSKCPFL